jgi:hypothetical protein
MGVSAAEMHPMRSAAASSEAVSQHLKLTQLSPFPSSVVCCCHSYEQQKKKGGAAAASAAVSTQPASSDPIARIDAGKKALATA